jgi:hypothetical protein
MGRCCPKLFVPSSPTPPPTLTRWRAASQDLKLSINLENPMKTTLQEVIALAELIVPSVRDTGAVQFGQLRTALDSLVPLVHQAETQLETALARSNQLLEQNDQLSVALANATADLAKANENLAKARS